MSEPATDLARREHGDALSTILGTGDTRAALAQVEKNVRDIIQVARERGFVTHFVDTNKRTGETRESDFYGFPAWQLLGLTYGVTPIVEWVHPVDGGFQARAEARTRDGSVVGAAEAFCYRKEPGKQYKSDHDLAAMAQTRAQRNALRGALGAALVLAGFDFPDPDAPASNGQVGILHQLERELGWHPEQGHVEAGDVASYKELTREEASVLIDRWTSLRDQAQGREAESPPSAMTEASSTRQPSAPDPQSEPGDRTGAGGVPGGGDTDDAHDVGKVVAAPSDSPPAAPDPHAPATAEQWARAAQHGLTGGKAVKMARDRWGVKGQSEITREQLAALLEELLG